MRFYIIRLKRWPDVYMGKRAITFSLLSDAEIKRRIHEAAQDGITLTAEEILCHVKGAYTRRKDKARVWQNASVLHGTLTNLKHLPGTLNEYEVIEFYGTKEFIRPLNDFLRKPKKVPN